MNAKRIGVKRAGLSMSRITLVRSFADRDRVFTFVHPQSPIHATLTSLGSTRSPFPRHDSSMSSSHLACHSGTFPMSCCRQSLSITRCFRCVSTRSVWPQAQWHGARRSPVLGFRSLCSPYYIPFFLLSRSLFHMFLPSLFGSAHFCID